MQFYKSLMNIKQMILRGEDVSSLGLHLQTPAGTPLVAGGGDIPVTNDNALTYIYLLAKVCICVWMDGWMDAYML
jgi:hypothetical protein